MRVLFFLFLFLIISPGLSSQSSVNETAANPGPAGNININQDERLNELVRRHIMINKEKQGIPGYRIRIFSESGQMARSRANNVRANFFNKYPEFETYLDYDQPPNFRVYVGDFRTRSEALKIQKKINRDYPYSFIVSQMINFPSLD
jgi:hypothetical protein